MRQVGQYGRAKAEGHHDILGVAFSTASAGWELAWHDLQLGTKGQGTDSLHWRAL